MNSKDSLKNNLFSIDGENLNDSFRLFFIALHINSKLRELSNIYTRFIQNNDQKKTVMSETTKLNNQ